MVAAKTDRTHEGLAKQFAAHSIDRRYPRDHRRHPPPRRRHGRRAPRAQPAERKKVAIVQGGKRAVTHYRTIEKLNNAALVECRLETGRTHRYACTCSRWVTPCWATRFMVEQRVLKKPCSMNSNSGAKPCTRRIWALFIP